MDKTELIQFRIDAFTPDTLPMSRLAEYLTQLADLLGSHEHVHFTSVRKGSAIPQAKVDYPAIPKVQARLQLAHSVDAPDDIRKPFEAINRLLKADNAKATLKAGTVVYVKFPGRDIPDEKPYRLREAGCLDGIVIRIGGTDRTIPVWLRSLDEQTIYKGIETTPETARALVGHYLGKPVRVHGQGVWERSGEGDWGLVSFHIAHFEELDETPADEVFAKLASHPGNGWAEFDDPIKEHQKIRGSD
ncbi:MFS transporter [Burkholderia pseudomallei]|uniref:MFS transporter n=1 Tax=Burkholderia pseudomallei TaxID=28450 RepID=UPI00097788F9|nr:MFS transporter [Burkholderia pseudomallei]ONC43626.1 MFS transporter [Burkholderia pseudomallei]